MLKKKSDVKFIIYQSLYIFVVCVVAIKGANLDLVQVVEDDGKPKVVLTPEAMDSIQQRLQYSVIVDTNHFVVVPKELLVENEKLQQIVQNMPKIDLNQYVLKTEIPQIEPVKIEDRTEEKKEIVLGELRLVQYRDNVVNNKGDAPITVKGITILPHTSKSIPVGGESSVLVTSGDVSKTFATIENQKPSVNVQAMVPLGGDEIHLSKIQAVVGYRVTIADDYADQLDIKITGAVLSKVTKQTNREIVIDVTLNAFPSKASFDNYANNYERDMYTTSFNVVVKDKVAPHSISRMGIFNYTEW